MAAVWAALAIAAASLIETDAFRAGFGSIFGVLGPLILANSDKCTVGVFKHKVGE